MVEVDHGVFAPEAGLELFAGDDLAWTLEESGEDFEGLALQFDAEAGFPEFSALQIDLVKPEAEPCVRNLARHLNSVTSRIEFTTSEGG